MSEPAPLTPALSPAGTGERGTVLLVLLVLLAACGVKASPRPPEPRPAVPTQVAAPPAPAEKAPRTAPEKAP